LRSSLILALLCVGGAAHAFDDASGFFANPVAPPSVSASTGGVYFTGSPRWSSLDCSTCHTDGPGIVTVHVGSSDATLFTLGYAPGTTYELQIELRNETEGLMYGSPTCTEPTAMNYVQCNNNSFGLEIDDDAHDPVGKLCSEQPGSSGCPMPNILGDDTVVSPDGQAVFGNRKHSDAKTVSVNDPVRWSFWWTAPPQGTGPVTIYLGAVDGNGGAGTRDNDQDPYNDDTVSATIALQELNAAVPTGVKAGCSLARPDARALVPLCLLLGVALLLRRRRRPL
jgi:hypothetical protein